MKKVVFTLFLMVFVGSVLFAQKAYDLVVYKGKWGNFNITLNYGLGYQDATKLVAVNSKTGARKVYSINYEGSRENVKLCLNNPTNKTNFCIKESELTTQKNIITVAISWDDHVEYFEMQKVK